MKANISLALNGILLIAVIYLFTRQSAPASEAGAEGPAATEEASQGLNIVYVNADTLLDNLGFFKEEQEKLAKREEQAMARLNQRGKALESEFRQVQQKVQQGLLAPSQIAEEEQRLGRKQQELLAEQEKLSKELGAETRRIQEQLEKKLRETLDGVRTRRGYDYIFQYGQGSSVLLASDSLDITQEVLTIMNEEKGSPAESPQDTSGQ